MYPTFFHITQTASTNRLLVEKMRTQMLPSGTVFSADFQLDGRGQAGNSWESECGKNLIFSILFVPKNLEVEQHFILAQASSLAVKAVLDEEISAFSANKCTVKWANDIYFGNRKICGILIENTLKNRHIQHSIIGVGININQTEFYSNALNPVSLAQITGKQHCLNDLRRNICEKMLDLLEKTENYPALKLQYFNALYRKDGFYPYQTPDGKVFHAQIVDIQTDGKLILETENGEQRGFYFKQVRFVQETAL